LTRFFRQPVLKALLVTMNSVAVNSN